MRTIRVHLSPERAAAESSPSPMLFLRSAVAGEGGELPAGVVAGIDRSEAALELCGGSVHRGVVRLLQPAGQHPSPRETSPKSRPRPLQPLTRRFELAQALWVVPGAEVSARLRAAGIPPGAASRGLCHALRTLAGLYTVSGESRVFEAAPVAGWRGSSSPAMFLLAQEAADVRALFGSACELLRDAFELLDTCGCARGCDSCTGRHLPPDPAAPELVPDRADSLALVRGLLGGGEGSRKPLGHGPRVIRVRGGGSA